MGKEIVSHAELEVYRKAFDPSMQIFKLSQ